MFEHKGQPLLPRRAFIVRSLRHALFALGFIVASLLLGVAGYHHFERQSFIDSLLNAAMILGGMGPVGELHTTGGKLFASFYALFSGIGFLVIAGVLFAPVIHRFFHKFHLAADEGKAGGAPAAGGRQRSSSLRQRPGRAAGAASGSRTPRT
ncbi:MAG TPA: hypothetical protein VHQ90_18875 [Thermoanaerobaculia bacterium]|nr:hypothetical protein [Thermoanaerobaculia bacterium]